MSKGINKAILVGNLGADPETRHLPSGGAVTNIRLATADSWKDKQTGERVERTEWHRVVFFNRLAEIAAEYLRKGAQIYIEGRIQTRKWQDKDGADRYSTEIIAAEMQMLGSRGGGDHYAQASMPEGGAQAARPISGTASQAREPKPHPIASQKQSEAAGDFDDDIPF